MEDVFIIGAGQVTVQKETNRALKELGSQAIKSAIKNANISKINAIYIGNMLSGIVEHQQQLGPLIATDAELKGIEALTVEAACASGAAALHLGILAIKSGMYDCVVVCGIEKMSSVSKEVLAASLATASDWELEGSTGATFISLNAKLMQDYMNYYGISPEVFGGFGVNAHKNAMTNPDALFHKPITQQDYENSKIIEHPLRLYDVCPVCDGAAALVLVSKSLADSMPKNQPKVAVRASAVATDTQSLNGRKNLHILEAARRSSKIAYEQAKVSIENIDLFELHDAYSIISILSLEEAGFAKPGRGFELAMNGDISLNGKIPISTFGGLKARGHPVGATGIYQCVEVFLQLTHQAKENQVHKASIGMCQNIGGVGTTVITHILEAV